MGSVLVYFFVAACSASGGLGDLVEKATGGLKNMMEGTGAFGSGASNTSPNGGTAETGSGATRGEGEGASGGRSIMNPVPEADAAEDGTRIVNMYRTTADGLKVPYGSFWDKELGAPCSFLFTSDGKERCVPSSLSGNVANYYANSTCSTPLANIAKGTCAQKYSSRAITEMSCTGGPSYKYQIYEMGSQFTSVVYEDTGEACVEMSIVVADLYDFYAVTEVDLSRFAEGALVHE